MNLKPMYITLVIKIDIAFFVYFKYGYEEYALQTYFNYRRSENPRNSTIFANILFDSTNLCALKE